MAIIGGNLVTNSISQLDHPLYDCWVSRRVSLRVNHMRSDVRQLGPDLLPRSPGGEGRRKSPRESQNPRQVLGWLRRLVILLLLMKHPFSSQLQQWQDMSVKSTLPHEIGINCQYQNVNLSSREKSNAYFDSSWRREVNEMQDF